MSRSTRRASCVVISHGYLEPEVAKSLDALAAHLDVRLVTPRRSPVLVFADRRAEALHGSAFDVVSYRRFPRQGGLFVFASLRLGLQDKPDHVLIEYDPWTPLFWQVILASSLYSRRSGLHVVAKKNTFRKHPRSTAAVKRALARAGLRRVAGVLAASRKVAGLYRDEFGVADSSIDVVPMHPVDTEHFRPDASARPAGPVTIGFVGHLDSRKGVDVLLDAVEVLAAEGVPVVLHAVGPMGDVRARAERAAAAGTLVWQPPVANSEVAPILRRMDIFVMPSARLPDHEEHDGRALLEAMATELACVGSESGIIPELLADGRGRVFPAGDAATLAGELRLLAADPEERGRLGKKARAHVEQTASLPMAALARVSALDPHRKEK